MSSNAADESRVSEQGATALTRSGSVSPRCWEPEESALATLGVVARSPTAEPVRRVTLNQLLRHKWLALAVFLGFAPPVGVLIWFWQVPVYEARAAVIVEPRRARIAYRTDDNRGVSNYRQHRNNQAANLRDPAVLNRALDRPDVQQTRWYKQAPLFVLGEPPSRLERLSQDLTLNIPRDSSFIYVSMKCQGPREAALIVNAVIDEYVEFVRHEFDENEDVILRVLEDKLERTYLDVKTLKDDITNLLENSGLYTENPDALIEQQRLRLDTKEAQLRELQHEIELSTRRSGRQHAQDSSATAQTEQPAAEQLPQRTLYASDPEWRQLNENMKDTEFAVQLARERFGESHTKMVELRMAVDHTRQKLEAREAELDKLARVGAAALSASSATDAGWPPTPRELAAHLGDLHHQAGLLGQEIEQAHKHLKQTVEQVGTLKARQAELGRLEDQLAILRQNEEAMKTEKDAPPAIKTRRAVLPSQAANANRRFVLIAMAVFGGLALGLATAYLRASTSQAIHEAADVLAPAEMPFLGYLPRVRDPGVLSPQEQSVLTECTRMVRTALLERLDGRQGSAVLVTSAGSGAGKTTVALLLAESLAHCGKRVLLVDADLRNSSLGKRYDVPEKPGLVGLLTGVSTENDAIAHKATGGLHVLPAGARNQADDQELLANGTLSACLERWRGTYDVVVFDTPPVIPVADARILARQVDGTVLVVREGHCRRDEVVEALAAVSTTGGRLLGTVLVGSPRRRGYAAYYSRVYGAAPAGGKEVESEAAQPIEP